MNDNRKRSGRVLAKVFGADYQRIYAVLAGLEINPLWDIDLPIQPTHGISQGQFRQAGFPEGGAVHVKQVKRTNNVQFTVRNMDKAGDAATQIKQSVHFHSGCGLAKFTHPFSRGAHDDSPLHQAAPNILLSVNIRKMSNLEKFRC